MNRKILNLFRGSKVNFKIYCATYSNLYIKCDEYIQMDKSK